MSAPRRPADPSSLLPVTIVRVASWLVPAASRTEWLGEWLGELAALRADRSRSLAPGRARILALRRALLSFPDAARLRIHSLRLGLLGHEVRAAVRSFRRRAGSSLAIVGTIAIGIAAAAVVVSLVDGILNRPLPYPAPDEVVLVGPRWLDGRESSGYVAVAEYIEIRERNRSFVEVGAIDDTERTLIGVGRPVELPGARLTASAFRALGVPAALGRTFVSGEDRPGGADVVVLTDGMWRRAFGGDPGALGAEVRFGESSYRVVGVMPADFVLPTEVGASAPSEFFLPLVIDPADPGPVFFKDLSALVARLGPEVPLEAAVQDVERLAAEIVAEHPDNYDPDEWTLGAYDPLEQVVADARPVLRILAAAAGLLVLVICANLAGFLSFRGEERRASLATKMAIGAPTAHVVRSVLIEALFYAGAGGVLGTTLAAIWMPAVRGHLDGVLPRLGAAAVDVRVALAALTVVVTTAGLAAAGPALRLARSLGGMARFGRGTRRRRALRRWVIGGQLAVATVLLIAGGLFLRSLRHLVAVDPGFRSSGVQTVELSLPPSRYPTTGEVEDFYLRLVADLRSAPRVDAAGIVRRRPMADRYGTWTMAIQGDGEPRRLDDDPPRWQVVTPGYFEALSIEVEEGRLLTEAEMFGAAAGVVVNRAFADRYWPGRRTPGTRVRMDGGTENPWLPVVGVVSNVRNRGPRFPPDPVLYVPHPHFDEATSVGTQRTMVLALRTELGTAETRELVEGRLAALDPELPHRGVRPLDDVVAASFADTRVLGQIVSVFALVTLLLGGVGVYQTLAYEVAARTREIGIRSALGADRARLVRSVVGEGVVVTMAALLAGLGVALLTVDRLAGYLFGIPARDPVAFAAVPLVLLVTAVLASYVPARRAARADPVTPLRLE